MAGKDSEELMSAAETTALVAQMMPLAATLGAYRAALQREGFSREEAVYLVSEMQTVLAELEKGGE